MQKKYFYSHFVAYISLLACVFAAVYIIDPEQQFNFDEFNISPFVKSESALLTASRIKNASYQTAALGTSSMNSFKPEDIDSILHTKAINCHLPGSSYAEQEMALELIYQQQPTAHILLGLDYFTYNLASDRIREHMENYAFKNKILELHRYIFSTETYALLIQTIRSKRTKQQTNNTEDERPQNTEVRATSPVLDIEHNGVTLGHFRAFLQPKHDSERMKTNFNRFLISAQQHPKIEYRLIFPAYSIVYWLLLETQNDIDSILKFKRYVIESCEHYPNIKVYDFQSDEPLITNLDNYSDYFHTTPTTARYILRLMKIGERKINSQNIQSIYHIKNIIEKERPKYKNFVQAVIDKA